MLVLCLSSALLYGVARRGGRDNAFKGGNHSKKGNVKRWYLPIDIKYYYTFKHSYNSNVTKHFKFYFRLGLSIFSMFMVDTQVKRCGL